MAILREVVNKVRCHIAFLQLYFVKEIIQKVAAFCSCTLMQTIDGVCKNLKVLKFHVCIVQGLLHTPSWVGIRLCKYTCACMYAIFYSTTAI